MVPGILVLGCFCIILPDSAWFSGAGVWLPLDLKSRIGPCTPYKARGWGVDCQVVELYSDM